MIKQLLYVLISLSAVQLSAQDDLWRDASLPPEALKEDLLILEQIMEESHAGIEKYSSELDRKAYLLQFKDNQNPQSLTQCYASIAGFIDLVHDGHTYVMPSKQTVGYLLATKRFLPLTVRVNGTTMRVHQNFSDCYALDEGTEITKINGMSIRAIVSELLPYFTSDGFSLTGKLGGLEGQFWWYYGIHFGTPEIHEITYRTPLGEGNVKVFSIHMNDRISEINEVYAKDNPSELPVRFEMIENAGYLRVSSFNGMNLNQFEKAFDAAFDVFNEKNATHVVIDLRGNGGGREGVENLLLSYLDHNLDMKYDEVEIGCPTSSHYKYLVNPLKRRVEDLVYRAVEFRKNDQGKWLRRDRFQRTFISPDYIFSGKVSILIDKSVFSGASEFAALAKDYVNNCELVGQEACGGYQGHTSGYYYQVILPNTKFVVNLPRIWFDLNVKGNHNGGVQPDVVLIPTSMREDRDVMLDFVLRESGQSAQK